MKQRITTIVVPLYNERESIAPLCQKISAIAKTGKLGSVQCVVVDDGSRDGSFEELKKIRAHASFPLTIIRFRKNMGKSAALAVGFAHAKGDVVATIDADLQDDPAELPKFIKEIENGYDVVVGWRVNRNDPWIKRLQSKIFNSIVSRVTHIPIHDFNIGMKMYKKEVIDEIDVYGQLHRFIPVLAASRGFKITEVVVTHYAREFGKSKFGVTRIAHAGFDLTATLFLQSFQERPLRLFGSTGITSFFIGLGMLVYLSVLHFQGIAISRRPLLILGVLLVVFGVQLVSTGFIGELLTSYNYQKDKYPIEEIIS